jgi:hypothetical protein
MHFGLLSQRGLDHAPREILKLFAACGFDHTSWPDSSHLVARKSAPAAA